MFYRRDIIVNLTPLHSFLNYDISLVQCLQKSVPLYRMRDLLLNRDRPPQHESRLPVISYDQVLGRQIIMNYRQSSLEGSRGVFASCFRHGGESQSDEMINIFIFISGRDSSVLHRADSAIQRPPLGSLSSVSKTRMNHWVDGNLVCSQRIHYLLSGWLTAWPRALLTEWLACWLTDSITVTLWYAGYSRVSTQKK